MKSVNYILFALFLSFSTINARNGPCDTLKLQDFKPYVEYSTQLELVTSINTKVGIPLPLKDTLTELAVCLNQPSKLSQEEIIILTFYASAFFQFAELEKSKRICNSILEQFPSDTYSPYCSEAYNNLANIAELEGDWLSAFYFFNKLLEWKSYNRKALNNSAYLNLGAIYTDVENYSKADSLFQKSLVLIKENPSENMLEYGWVHFRLGELRRKQGLYKEAEKLFLTANEHWNSIKHPRGSCYTNSQLGIIYKETKSLEETILFLNQNKPSENHPDSYCRAEYCMFLGEAYLEDGETDLANICLQESMELAKESNYKNLLLQIYSSLLKVSLAINDSEKIKKYYHLYNSLNQFLSNQLKSETIQSKNQFEQLIHKEQKYHVLKQQEIYNEAQLRIQRIVVIIILVLLLMTSLLAYTYYYYNRQNKKKTFQLLTLNKAINLQKEELELSSEKIKDQKRELEYQLVNKVILNGQFKEVIQKVKQLVKEEDFHSQKSRILKELEHLQTNLLEGDLNLQISKTNQDFFQQLSIQYPSLTQSDLRLCAFLKMNLTTKEIARITSNTPDSVKVSRSRLRKKLGLTHQKKAISVFLNQLPN